MAPLRTLRARLILSHILPVLVIIPLIALLAYFVLANQNTLTEIEIALEQEALRLTDQATLLAQVSGQVANVWSNPERAQEFISNVNLEFSTVMLLDAEGRILASSDPSDAARLGDLLESEDVRAILTGQSKVEIQYSDPAGRRIADVLLPVLDADSRLNGVVRLTQEVASVQQGFDRVYALLLAVVVFLVAAGVTLGLFLALRLERSLQQVTTALQDIAVGQPPESLPEQGVAELDQVYRAVEHLVERLQTLEDARRRLLANLVHELGRPLGSLRAAIHALRLGADRDPTLRGELLGGMDHQITLMEPLLEDLTRLHGQVLGSLELNRQPVALSQWLPELLVVWREAARQKGVPVARRCSLESAHR
ncbi:MAG: hypothetical protein HC802_18185 [Caldilineaceae bacterium]|nr:hypothetical protein [Caldilineaceae bacterium]